MRALGLGRTGANPLVLAVALASSACGSSSSGAAAPAGTVANGGADASSAGGVSSNAGGSGGAGHSGGIAGVGPDAAAPTCASATECHDGFSCTIDSCNAGTCAHTIGPTAGVTACPAGKYCTIEQGCVASPACATDAQCAALWATDACKADPRCDPATSLCLFTLLDKDGDGHAPQVCGGDDCDDSNKTAHPGAVEVCDGFDNDCDGVVDNGAPCANSESCVDGACTIGGQPSLCKPYCDAVQKNCPSSYSAFFGHQSACFAACAALPQGTLQDTSGNTVGCRAHFAVLAAGIPEPNQSCSTAEKGGPPCVDAVNTVDGGSGGSGGSSSACYLAGATCGPSQACCAHAQDGTPLSCVGGHCAKGGSGSGGATGSGGAAGTGGTSGSGSATGTGGAAGSSCPSGYGDCDGNATNGCETNLAMTYGDCGTCGHACGFAEHCTYGTCLPSATCPLCGCIDRDPQNCGSCGTVCANGDECHGGTCQPPCNKGFDACGTTCVSLDSDPANCGGCGYTCAPGYSCVLGGCTL